MNTSITDQTFDEERALYHLQNAAIKNCVFAGPADGESALKEARDIVVSHCRFSLRYPLWHTHTFCVEDCSIDTRTRAPLWYARHGKVVRSTIDGIKCLRECEDVTLTGCTIHSPEFGWKCRQLDIRDCDIESEYLLFESENVHIHDLRMTGKYSFQYMQNLHIQHAQLDTKDAFWHGRNITVEDSVVKGEYLGWYSDGLTFIRCHIIGTQPLCYCRHLKLIDCTMEDTDLAFEYSDVEAIVHGGIVSVKNPRSGYITADTIGTVLLEDSIMDSHCDIRVANS